MLERHLAVLWANAQTERWLESLKVRVTEIEKNVREAKELILEVKRESDALHALRDPKDAGGSP